MRILIADDHDLVRETLAAYLTQTAGFAVSGAGCLPSALEVLAGRDPVDLALLDWHMPGMAGIEPLKHAMQAAQGAPVAVISGGATREVAASVLAAGAAGFLPKSLSSRSVVAAVHFMIAGEVFVPRGFMTPAEEGGTGDGAGRIVLTRREAEVLRGLSEGKSNKEIARDHGLQEVTVKLHVKTLSRKLGARNRTHAAMLGRDLNLL
ncbi:response regulator transcription factor [Pseudoroseicyclus aestuarii]|uniref:LuxR family two component transcriptional regulator n=1 Tax=Pseudoroseicyclus aestuarii TaxID=1795041 RepID=A0A318SS04_9RHOB|nr:response regulator transcription factor [Pseudoroseicyclus aestuarii]PYE84731.1 LuxR family two component transcriptional regulator [Pseudoroseicyclus aestuarii]